MKKVFFLAVVALTCTLSSEAQTRFGVKGGYTMGRWGGDIFDKDENRTNHGFHLGVLADVKMSDAFYFQPNLLFNRKGGAEFHDDHKDKFNVSAIDLPLNIVFKSKGEQTRFFAGTGPNLGFNLSAVEVEEGKKENLVIGSGADADLKRFDLGWNFLAGVELKNGLFFSANYTPGLVNLATNAEVVARSNFAHFSVGYFFGGKKK